MVNGLRHKNQVKVCYEEFVTRTELETGERSAALCLDAGGEYTGGRIEGFMRKKGITHKFATAETPEHDGVSERMNRILIEKARSLLADSKLPHLYWFDAVEYATLIHNVTPS